MRLHNIVIKSLRQHWLSTGLAVFSIAMGIALLVAVFSLREQTSRNFRQVGMGVDAILAPKGSPLQITLVSLFHLEEMPRPGVISWKYMKQVEAEPTVVEVIPFCVGHTFGGFRVNAIDKRFLTDFEYRLGRKFSFKRSDGGRGRPFDTGDEAVAGWAAAKELGIRIGMSFNPVCGVAPGSPAHVDDHIRFVGIMAPTGTPHDRAIYMPLERFYTLGGHENIADMAADTEHRTVSGAYVKLKRILGGKAISPDVQGLQFAINQSSEAQLIRPEEVLPKLFNIIGWVDRVLLAIAAMVTVLGTVFLFVSLISALRERRRDIALMRSLGATRMTVFGLMLIESASIAIVGAALGCLLGHLIVGIGAYFIRVETGVALEAGYIALAEWFVLPGALVLGILTGILPAVQAYRLGVLKNLVPLA